MEDDSVPTWEAVLSLVPEARSVPQSRSDAITRHVSTLPHSPQESTPGRMLAEVLTVAAGPAGPAVREELDRDAARRGGWARGGAEGPVRRWTRRICIALAVAAILISGPSGSRYGGDAQPMFEPGTTLLAAGVLALVSVVGLLALASRARTRTGGVWYPALALLLGVGLIVTIFRVDPDSYRPLLDQLGDYLLRETVGAVLLLVAVLGFIALTLLVRRRPTVAQLVLGYSEDAHRFDEELLEDVRQVIHARDDVHSEALRAQTVTGVHELFDTGRVDALGATRLLRELVEHYPPAEAPRS